MMNPASKNITGTTITATNPDVDIEVSKFYDTQQQLFAPLGSKSISSIVQLYA